MLVYTISSWLCPGWVGMSKLCWHISRWDWRFNVSWVQLSWESVSWAEDLQIRRSMNIRSCLILPVQQSFNWQWPDWICELLHDRCGLCCWSMPPSQASPLSHVLGCCLGDEQKHDFLHAIISPKLEIEVYTMAFLFLKCQCQIISEAIFCHNNRLYKRRQ